MLNCPASELMITYELQIKRTLAKLAQLSGKRVNDLLTNFKSNECQQNLLNSPASESNNYLQTSSQITVSKTRSTIQQASLKINYKL